MEEDRRYSDRETPPEGSSSEEALRRKRRRAMLKKRRERQLRRARILATAAGVVAAVVLLVLIVRAVRNVGAGSQAANQPTAGQTAIEQAAGQAGEAQQTGTAQQPAAGQTGEAQQPGAGQQTGAAQQPGTAQDAPQVQLADPEAASEEEPLTLAEDTSNGTAGQGQPTGQDQTAGQDNTGTAAGQETPQPTTDQPQEWTPSTAEPGSEEQIDVSSDAQEQPAAEGTAEQPVTGLGAARSAGPGSETGLSEEVDSFHPGYVFTGAGEADYIDSDGVQSSYALIVDVDSGKIVAGRDFEEQINPASMTKILTLLVAVEHLTDEQIANRSTETFTITEDIFTRAYKTGSSVAGWYPDDEVTLEDLLYGTILPSGADGAMGLAIYTAGSEEKFVGWMNQKLKDLGLSDTAHFTNCIGLYDEDHYCTLTDMAAIMKAAVENDLCREVLSAHTYSTSSTENAPDGIGLSNWFLRRIEDKETNGEVVAAKTGFVKEAGNCAASYQVSDDGGHYICVTANAWSAWRCIYDHVEIYTTYTE